MNISPTTQPAPNCFTPAQEAAAFFRQDFLTLGAQEFELQDPTTLKMTYRDPAQLWIANSVLSETIHAARLVNGFHQPNVPDVGLPIDTVYKALGTLAGVRSVNVHDGQVTLSVEGEARIRGLDLLLRDEIGGRKVAFSLMEDFPALQPEV